MTEIENDITREIINIGLSKAGDSLSFFTKEKVLINSLNYTIERTAEISEIVTKNTDELIILTSEIRGEMSGYCFLIFTPDEVQKLCEISLPEEILRDPDALKEMSAAILMEADNILTASVITQFSNLLTLKIYGYVPTHRNLTKNDAVNYLKEKVVAQDFIMKFNVQYRTENKIIEPEFIWALDNKFIESIIKFSQSDENIKIIEKLKSN